MAINAEQMANALNKARFLMSEEGNSLIKDKVQNADLSKYEGYDYQSLVTSQPTYIQENNISMGNGASKLPKAIVESMMNNQIDTSVLDPNGMGNVMKIIEQQAPLPKKQEYIKEDKVLPVSNGVIDYSLIKNIIEECIDRKLKELNENTLKGIKLKEGKIALVDNGGNVFHANLEYKGKQKK